mgnify:CR=1 FL=1|jgi:hypothetical protein|tara:strand:+ start:1896 stop:2123 length:228 start_codon:yes stop_codon:yes gene_type:complete
MTDRQILDEIYNRLCNMLEATDGNGTGRALKSFIEEEWQKRDEMESMKKEKWFCDVREMERYRGLEIGKDGTVGE